jgi:hypothetical protein
VGRLPAGVVVHPDPGLLTSLRASERDVFYFEIVGRLGTTIWGSDVYTDDSPLATAAVHAGVVKLGERGIVKVTILPGQQSYQGSTRNGILSESYRDWQRSYRIEALPND